jgi:hypothetical protein
LTRTAAVGRAWNWWRPHLRWPKTSYAQIVDQAAGEVRLFFEPGSLGLQGGWMVGASAADVIGEIGLAVASGLSAFDLARFADQHPHRVRSDRESGAHLGLAVRYTLVGFPVVSGQGGLDDLVERRRAATFLPGFVGPVAVTSSRHGGWHASTRPVPSQLSD